MADEWGLRVARKSIAKRFQKLKLWSPPFAKTLLTSKEDAATLENSAHAILQLLERFPTLASEKFRYPIVEAHAVNHKQRCCYPLTIFVWNNMCTEILDKVFNLYPAAFSEPQLHHSSLLEMACDWIFATKGALSDTTLHWLLTQADTVPECVVHRLILFRDFLACASIQLILEKTPELQDDDSSSLLVNLLFASGYGEDAVALVLDHRSDCGCNCLALNTEGISWILNSSCARLVVNMLPKLTGLRLESLNWTLEGWKTVLTGLCQCDTIEIMHLQLDASWLLHNEGFLPSLETFLAYQTSCAWKLSLELIGTDDRPNHRRHPGEGTRLLQCLLNVWKANPISEPCVETLQLKSLTVPSHTLVQLEEFVSTLRLQSVVILAETIGGKGSKSSDGGKESSQYMPSQKAWDALAMLPQLETSIIERNTGGVTIEHRCNTTFSIRITSSRLRPLIRDLQLDITDILVSLLQYQSLHGLLLILPGYSFDVKHVCQALGENDSLRSLSLIGLGYNHDDAKDIPTRFLQVLQEKNATLQEMRIFNHESAVTFRTDPDPCYLDVSRAEQIQYLLRLNKFGRQQFREETSLLPNICHHLGDVQELESATMRPFSLDGVQLTEEELILDPTEQSNILFQNLRRTVNDWCSSRRLGAEKQSILYGLLREAPSLWCPVSRAFQNEGGVLAG